MNCVRVTSSKLKWSTDIPTYRKIVIRHRILVIRTVILQILKLKNYASCFTNFSSFRKILGVKLRKTFTFSENLEYSSEFCAISISVLKFQETYLSYKNRMRIYSCLSSLWLRHMRSWRASQHCQRVLSVRFTRKNFGNALTKNT